VSVTTSFSRHPGVCEGNRLQTTAGAIVYLPDNEWSDVESEAAQVEPCTQENILLGFLKGSDIIILDAQYDRDEYDAHKGWGHGCVDDVVRLALLAEVKHLFLFHHDPEHSDEFVRKLVERARDMVRVAGSSLRVDAAREGERVILKAAEAVTT
jgi:ribonuclease BN (tRNA processing enzyme)